MKNETSKIIGLKINEMQAWRQSHARSTKLCFDLHFKLPKITFNLLKVAHKVVVDRLIHTMVEIHRVNRHPSEKVEYEQTFLVDSHHILDNMHHILVESHHRIGYLPTRA
jgi:hypothetical protein